MPANFSAAAVLNINGTVRITVGLGQFAGTNYRVLAPLAVPFLLIPVNIVAPHGGSSSTHI